MSADEYTQPAFPLPQGALLPGMLLRDYFAAKTMQAAMSHPCTGAVEDWIALNARFAYIAADAMLKAREA